MEMEMAEMRRMAGESAVVIFSVSNCCMCHAIKRLFSGLGVSPTVHELDMLPSGHPPYSQLPIVFVGGQLVGPTHSVIASHINGSLVPLLKHAGALWL